MLRLITYGALLFVSVSFATQIDKTLDVVINMSALLVINDLDKIFGNFFMHRLKVYHREILSSENFLKFNDLE